MTRQLHGDAERLLESRSWRAEQIRLPQRGKSGEDEFEVDEDEWRKRGHKLRTVLQDFASLPSRTRVDDHIVARILHELGWTYMKAPLSHDNDGAAAIFAESARILSGLMIAGGNPLDYLNELFHSTIGWAQAVDDAGDQRALALQLYNQAKALFNGMNGKKFLKNMLVPLDNRINDINLNALPMPGAVPLVYQLLPANLPTQPLLAPISPVGSPLMQLPPLPLGFAYPAQVPAAQAQPPPIQVQAPAVQAPPAAAQAPPPAVQAPPAAVQAPPPVALPRPPAVQAAPAVQAQPAAVALVAPPARAAGKRPRERLEELEDMKDFLSDAEYQVKRAEIIASV